ncbi:MAG: hypothetical protein UU08_C0026G0003 [Candidatus Uhrbacteria bacterium GW2011_GWE2_40_58]|nr:MAG: hypothetical protein UT94_C0035G0008 [Candidatus Uhrbacteria bacterium GW2011_GWF2_40_263]KKR67113.1 MAG: hypothetical protein UU08_C0026G0003 [Candidatus Uhrbacteria bacterium GW2011_GWE2_40_58]HCB56309.1 hypothetical protein [Candidatus Uhrbacteria bacterium]
MMHLEQLPNQRTNERMVLFIRRHWIAPFQIFGIFIILLLLPVAIGYLFYDNFVIWMQQDVFGPLISLIVIMYFLCVWLFSFIEFTDYYLDTWIVTTERIINIEQKGLFNRTASELQLEAVQDVTSDVEGVFRTIFDYGDVIIQTAGELKHFHFKEIPHPEDIKERIIHIVDQDREQKELQGIRTTPKPRLVKTKTPE